MTFELLKSVPIFLRSISVAFLLAFADMDTSIALCDEPTAALPPRLLEFAEAKLKADTDASLPSSGVVTARLYIDREGHVTEVEVVDSTDPAFVEPAKSAMMRFVFVPATQGGAAIESVAVYRYRFELQPKQTKDASPSQISKESSPGPPVNAAVPSNNRESTEADVDKDSTGNPYESVIRGERIYESVALHRIEAEQILSIAGIHGDAVLAIQTLPGVSKPPAMMGALFIRGSDYADSLSLVDSLPVPTVFHFGAVNTILNSDMIESVSFFPGNFSVRYGRGTGGVVDIHTRPPKTDRLHAYLDLDLWDTSVFAEGPISKHWSGAASFRRSYIDGVLKATGLLEDQLQLTVAPRYYDFQVKADYHPGHQNELSLFMFGSDDKVKFGETFSADFSYLSRKILTRTYFYMAGATWRHTFHRAMVNHLFIRSGYMNIKGEGATMKTMQRSIPVHLRDELSVTLIPELLLRLGVDSGIGRHEMEVREIPISDTRRKTCFEGHPGTYMELVLNAVPKTRLTYGIRADYNSLTGNWDVDPRLEAQYTPFRLTVLKAGFGLFHQPPDLFQSFEDDTRQTARSMSAVHYGLSVEQSVPKYELLKIYLGGFYKDLNRTSFRHEGVGRSMGLEFMLNHRPSQHFFGWISYTLMKSERSLSDRFAAVPFDFDQTHLLTVVAGVSLKRNIGIGLRFRLASGMPYTPMVGTQLYDDWLSYTRPVWGDRNSKRMPLFHQLDLRIDKTFEWRFVKLSLYLDVQNVYNRQNAVLYIYNDDYTEWKPIYDLPVLPSLGLKVEY